MSKKLGLFTAVGISVVLLGLCSQVNAGLINHWKFDEAGTATTAVDSASGLNVTLQGDAAFVDDNERGQVIWFSGAEDASGISTSHASTSSGVPFTADITHTVSLWLYQVDRDPADPFQGWMSWGNASNRYFLGTNESGIQFGAGAGNNNRVYSDVSPTPGVGTWEYWTITRDLAAQTVTIYRNGTQVYEKTNATDCGAINASAPFFIGNYYNGVANGGMDGMMSDMAIWDETLTVDQIQNAMSLGAENYNVPEPSSIAMLLAAALGMLLLHRKR